MSSTDTTDTTDTDTATSTASTASTTASQSPATMKGFYVSKPGDTHGALRLDIPIPVPGNNEAKIQVLRAGVCNTDLEILQGYMGFTGVLGHEFVGIVVEVNSEDITVKKQWMGKRVCGVV